MTAKVVYSCPFVPAEWIAAHNIEPLRLIPDSVNASAYGVCPYAAAFAFRASQEDDAAGIIVTTACDQMRRAADVIRRDCEKPVFLLNVPHTWQSPTAYKMYAAEIRRLGEGKVDAPRVAAVRSNVKYDRLMVQDNANRVARDAAFNTALTGDVGYQDRLLATIGTVTPEELSRFARKYLVASNSTTVTLQTTPAPATGGAN
jgi:hypothetical protein